MKMIGIYHNRDLDGFCSGAIIKKKYPDATMIGFDYGDSLSDLIDSIPKGEPIIMADVSLPMAGMMNLAQHSNWQLTWIDHHISAINDFKKVTEEREVFCNVVLDISHSACEGAWSYLFPSLEMPVMVTLLGEYDTWRNENPSRWSDEILPFQFGMRVWCNSLETFPHWWLNQQSPSPHDISEKTFIRDTISQGKTILKYQSQINAAQCKKAAFEIEFEGLRAICLNGGGFNSDVFKSVYDESKHDIMMPFQFDGKQWTISLYTTKDEVDCSVIAKSKGGGGHKKAAGFQVKEISKIFPSIN